MYIITERELILSVVARWRKQYADGRYGQDKLEVLKKLEALDLLAATNEEIVEIIGNASWTSMACNECGQRVNIVVQVGEPPDYESSTANLCPDCVEKAAALMRESLVAQ